MNYLEYSQVLGPFNSGTTLMDNYRHRLFAAKPIGAGVFWKHSIPPYYKGGERFRLKNKLSPLDQFLQETYFICMVRLPYFWLASTCRRAYNLKFHTPCHALSERIKSRVSLRGAHFPNLVVLWNEYYRRYQEYLEPLGHLQYVRLEDLSNNAKKTLKSLEGCLRRRPGKDLDAAIEDISNKPTKAHNTFGEAARIKYKTENVAKVFSPRDLDFINSQLDVQLLRKFDYPLIWPRQNTWLG